MSYKVSALHQIEHSANTCGCNKYTYLSGFEFKGDKYANGWVILNDIGMKEFGTTNGRVKIVDHWINYNNQHGYCIYYYNTKNMYHHKWDYIIYHLESLDEYLESAEDIDYKNISTDELLSLPKDEMAFHLHMKSIADGTYNPNPKVTPLFKDWEIPELMLGWVAFIAFFFIAFVFKDWYIQLILRLVGSWVFAIWRKQKIYGMK